MGPKARSEEPRGWLGDRLLLLAILLVGALPFLGWALHYDVARWELGVGTAVVLCGGAELIRDLLLRRRRDPPPPP